MTLDTSIFGRYGFNLEFPLLKSLSQFKAGNISVVFSDIVVEEVKSHISDRALRTQSEIRKAIKNFSKIWKSNTIDVAANFELDCYPDPIEFSAICINTFLDDVAGNIVISTADAKITKDVMRRYFSGTPPFGKEREKKAEFPDAFALVSIDQKFSLQGQYVLCVSADKGWHAFAKDSDWLLCVNDLDVALSYFHDTGRNAADKFVEILRNDADSELIGCFDFENAIQARLDDLDFEPEADTGLDFTADPMSASLQSVEFDTFTNPVIIDATDENVSFTTSVDALVRYEAEFSFFARDSIDKDYISLGDVYSDVESTHTFKLIISVNRGRKPSLKSVFVVKDGLEVHFGYVEPFPDEVSTYD